LQTRACIEEFTIHERPLDVVEKLLRHRPRIIGFSVYIWNVAQVGQVVAALREVSPQTILVLGGPEVSHAPDLPAVAERVDYIVQGAGEVRFRELCEHVLSAGSGPETGPHGKIITGEETPLEQLALPYRYYTDEDIRNRLIYVEASRGCPFKCEFCLSSLDKTARPFALTAFLDEMEVLIQRGARNFKFIDRTFNLKVSTSVTILAFFLERMTEDMYLHFEVVPDNLPAKLKTMLTQFPAHSLQFEVGVQTFDPVIQQRISRRQDNRKTADNLRWLREHTRAYIHADLIFGLPGDTLENFAKSFDQLVALRPHEIQLGILKRLRGAPLNRHNEDWRLRYNPEPPYNILSTRDISFSEMQRVSRFARFWDMVANSGRFRRSLGLMTGEAPFENFLALSDALYRQAGSTWKISLRRLFALLYDYLVQVGVHEKETIVDALAEDYRRSGEKGEFDRLVRQQKKAAGTGAANKRQKQMLL
ncbi:MAG TPA: DUF4080 domain-containing protein, partial [Thiotrichales bacterium]|nr:DUF4080 domain-containing protein [Thiotrichales bacterium]